MSYNFYMNSINHIQWLIILAIIIVISAVFFNLYIKNNSTSSIVTKEFLASPHNDKLILVSGWNKDELQKILTDFNKMYQNQGYPAYVISTTKLNANQYRLTFPEDIHPLLFIFLINYLAYPFNFDLKTHTITVAGSTTLNVDYEGLNPIFIGQKAIFYIPEHDSVHDAVYMLTSQGDCLSSKLTTGEWNAVNQKNLNALAKQLQTE
jgi:hypothetical protein